MKEINEINNNTDLRTEIDHHIGDEIFTNKNITHDKEERLDHHIGRIYFVK